MNKKKPGTAAGDKRRKSVKFDDGDLIFREGERGDAAYRLISGEVALLKNTDAGPIQIERIRPPAMFGETGILDQSRRTASARAMGPVQVEVIHRDAFLEEIKRDPEQALSMMSKLASQSGTAAGVGRDSGASASDSVLAGWLHRFLKPKPRPVPLVEVRVPGFAGESGDVVARHIMAGLEDFAELKVRAVHRPDTFPADGLNDENVSEWVGGARKLLLNNGGDVLVWGRVAGPGAATRLRLVSALPGDEDLAGNLTGFAEVPMPHEPDEQFLNLLKGAILAASAPQAGVKAPVVQAGLMGSLETVNKLATKPPRDLTPSDRQHLMMTCGHIMATAVQRAAAPLDAMKNALGLYKQALEMAPQDSGNLTRGLVLKNIGACLMFLGERENDPDHNVLALETMQAACDAIPRDIAPREWAAAHNRLGQILYRLDLTEADAEMTHLKRALAAFRNAMQVYTRIEAPERWADVMNNYAQVAQVLGGNLQNAKVLQNSVQACRNALEVRRRDKNPLLWASTQNTLGSGLFLLGKVTRRTDLLQAAVMAFEAALSVYRQSKSSRMAAVIERNLQHVHSLIEELERVALERVLSTDPETGQVIDEDWWKANVVDEDELHRATG
ncbi:MAG: cyclic nucleotide-binding domain-containing protein [Rhodospirillales bacterium]